MKPIVIALLIGNVDTEELRMTVYDEAKVLDEVRETVVFSLRRIFRQSGINIDWVTGVPGAPEASLMIYEPLRSGRAHHPARHGWTSSRHLATAAASPGSSYAVQSIASDSNGNLFTTGNLSRPAGSEVSL